MAQQLLNKVAVVTGAESGVGRAIAVQMLSEGAKVALFGGRAAPLEEVAARAPARALVVPGDVTRADDLRLLFDTAVRRFRGIDVVVPCAAEFASELAAEADGRLTEHLLRVNFLGAVETVRHGLPLMNRNGCILFLTSALTRIGWPGLAAFQASQAALAAYARTLAVELAPQGIRVNCLAPGPMQMPPDGKAVVDPARFGGRLTSPDDLAELAVFLASDAAQQICGQELVIDGGFTIQGCSSARGD